MPPITPKFASYKDIPGVTSEEISQIEALKGKYPSFVYGMTFNSEAFVDKNGEINGYSALFCSWLSQLFGITFKPATFAWDELLLGLENGTIDFSGELTPTAERRNIYSMTDPIAHRILKYFRIKGSTPLQDLQALRPLRFAVQENTVTIDEVIATQEPGTYEIVKIMDSADAYELLKNGEVDAFINENPNEAVFDDYSDIEASDYLPIVLAPVSFTTRKAELAPFISVVQRAIVNGERAYFGSLYKLGEQEYKKNKFFTLLTEEEKNYLRSHNTFKLAAEYYNYPVSFYNKYDKEWQGIVFDVLREAKAFVDLDYEIVNDLNTEWPELLAMLQNGQAQMITELVHSREREGHFLWPETSFIRNQFALVSKANFRNLGMADVYDVRVAVAKNTVYSENFARWFPDHKHTYEYDGADDSFRALDRGEVDLVMASYIRLLAMSNYHEISGYMANLTFDTVSYHSIAFNKNDEILCSITNKMFDLVDVNTITLQWMNKTYDYNAKVLRERRPFMVGTMIFLASTLVLMFVLFIIRHNEKKMLEKEVAKRTAELQKASEDLENAVKAAQEASFSKTVFLANMSHEIRTPMNSIIGFSELAMDDDIPAKTREYLGDIIKNSNWLLTMLNDVLDISKIEAGKMELESIPFDLHEIFTHCKTATEPKAIERGLILYFYAEPTIGKRLLGDPTRLHQIFINLLSNAVKFTRVGVIKLSSFITNQNPDETTICFEIRDSGIGMTKEQLDKLFKPFVQGDSSMTRLHGGTGLGLAITKNLVEMMGGKLAVESIPGIGTKFSFELTFKTKDVPVGEETKKIIPIEEIKKPTFDGEILICEDNLMNQRVIIEHLERVGIKPIIAENGQIGVDMVRERKERGEKPFDLIFMDIHMPVMDGLEASPKIVELHTGTPIVAMTANIMENDMELYKRSGIPDSLGKPFTSQELWRCLLKYLKPIGSAEVNKEQQAIDDKNFEQKMKAGFVKENQLTYDNLVKALGEGDIKTAHRIAHTLKTNAAHIGKTSLHKAALSVEQTLKGGENTLVDEQLVILKNELDAVLNELAPLLAAPLLVEAGTKPQAQAAESEANALLERLEPLLKDGNTESLKFIDDLRAIPDSGKLVEQIENFDFTDAYATLVDLKKRS